LLHDSDSTPKAVTFATATNNTDDEDIIAAIAVINSEQDELIKKYSIEINSLCDMGFTDISKSAQMLEANNGNLELTVEQYFNAQQ